MRFDTIWLDARLATLAPGRSGLGVVDRGAVAAAKGRIAFAGPMTELPTGWDASRTTSTKSASASASIDFLIPMLSASSRARRIPAVSTSLTGMPPMETVSVTKSRVVPGVAVTMARSRSTRRLKREDLPTFGRPTIASVSPSCTIFP